LHCVRFLFQGGDVLAQTRYFIPELFDLVDVNFIGLTQEFQLQQHVFEGGGFLDPIDRRDRGASRRTLSSGVVATVQVEREGPVLRITLTRPERRNAFDAELIRELGQAFVDVGKARAVVLAGEGASFCAGADVDWMRASVGLSFDENVADANAMRQMFEAIDNCPAPVVARVQGHALGGGAGLVAAADIAISARDATYAFSEVKLGIIPAVISPFALAKIGAGHARRYFVTGERFDAETALRIGLVSEVVDDLNAAVDHVVGELLSAGQLAARWAKRLVRERPAGPETARWIAERRASDEGQEGLRAFIEKRRAAWRDS